MADADSDAVNLPNSDNVIDWEEQRAPHRLSDEALAVRLQAGDVHALNEIVHRYQGRLFAVAYRVTGSREDALDVTQEVFLQVYRRIRDWRPTGKFGAWLVRLTVNRSIDAARRKRRRAPAVSLDSDGAPMAVSNDHTARSAHAAEIDERVQAALQVLSPAQRTVFVLRHYDGLPLAEIAPIMGCTVGSVKVHLFRAMKKLRVELEDLRNDL